jgi:ubiquinone biosynthesis protein UbiJ
MTIQRFATALGEDAGNRLLRLDADTLRRLGDVEGRVFCLQVLGAGQREGGRWYFFPSEGGFRIRQEFDGTPDVTISGSLPSFARLLGGERAAAVFRSGHMQISGDLELGQRFQAIFKDFSPDWEEFLSRYLGDALAHRLGRTGRAFRHWGRHLVETVRADAGEYLQEEARLVPRRERVDRFLADVDRLRSDVDRLAARVARLGD